MRLFPNIRSVVLDAIAFARNLCRSRSALAAENLFLRKQLTFFVERKQAPRRTDNATWLTMATLTRLFDWKQALIVVKLDTLVLWHRKGFRLFWRWKSRPKGRPTLPEELKKLIAEMAVANITWGEERIAHELLVKLGVRVSPRTVRKYIPIRDDGSPGRRNASHRWATFVRNHAKAVVAADFFNVVTVSFRVLYVFVIMEIGTRKMLHFNVTAHPTAEWTLQQFREAIGCEHDYRFVIVDRDDKFSADLRRSVRGMGVRPLRTLRRAPQANAYCERLIRNHTPGVLGFSDTAVRGTSPPTLDRMAQLLQSGETAFIARARPSHPLCRASDETGPAPASITRPARRCLEAGPWWAPSRLPVVTRRLTDLASRGEQRVLS